MASRFLTFGNHELTANFRIRRCQSNSATAGTRRLDLGDVMVQQVDGEVHGFVGEPWVGVPGRDKVRLAAGSTVLLKPFGPSRKPSAGNRSSPTPRVYIWTATRGRRQCMPRERDDGVMESTDGDGKGAKGARRRGPSSYEVIEREPTGESEEFRRRAAGDRRECRRSRRHRGSRMKRQKRHRGQG